MKTELTIDQLEQELESVRTQNQKVLKELHDLRNENDHLRKKFQQDREWLCQTLERLFSHHPSSPVYSAYCDCGLEAVLEQAQKRASIGLRLWVDSPSVQ